MSEQPPLAPRVREQLDRVETLLQALPYIRRFQGRVVVVKFGGNAMTTPELFSAFAEDVVLMHQVGMRPIVVHGGGPQISEWLGRMGKEAEFVDGRRVTDAETLEVAIMVLLGKVNSEIVAALNTHGPLAVGLSGQSAQLISASPHDPELGFVGRVDEVNPEIIERLLAMDLIPVVATIGGDAEGQAYNINADDVAAAIAESVNAEKLVFLTDVPGLLADVDDPTSLIQRVDADEVAGLIESGVISGGMIPKMAGCVRAVEAGVGAVHLVDGRLPHVLLLELFTDAGVGTMIEPAGHGGAVSA